MADYAPGRLDFDDENLLPWLEPATEEPGNDGISPLRLLGLILVGLVLIGLVVGGIWLLRNGTQAGGGEGQLIAAPTDSYKLPANEADARKFDGEGDASFAASEGVARDGRIDPTRVPEAPIAKTSPAPAASRPVVAEKPAQSVTARVEDETAPKPVAAPAAGTGGAMVQLGAYASASGAKDAWTRLSKRFAYLAPLAMTVEPAQVGGGTVYRLRAAAGGQASTVCGKLKVAGESCMVVN